VLLLGFGRWHRAPTPTVIEMPNYANKHNITIVDIRIGPDREVVNPDGLAQISAWVQEQEQKKEKKLKADAPMTKSANKR
jgi:hypothetical protein